MTTLSATGLLTASERPGNAAAHRRPNVLVIVSDDAGYADFGCYGCQDIPTPHIDALAQGGVRLTQGYVSASVCAPSRSGLMTGRYQQRFGSEFNGPSKPEPGFTQADMGLDLGEKTFGEAMKAQGYRTIAIGKWHLGYDDAYFPLRRGFDEFYGIRGGSRSYFPMKSTPGRGNRLQSNWEVVPEQSFEYMTDELTDVACDYLQRETDQPFFMYLAFTAVHGPLQGKPEDLAEFQNMPDMTRRTYAAMMRALDRGIGRVTTTLRERGLERDTLLVFVNDNGGATNNGSDNGPLRGMKGSKWEGGIRVGFLLKWPARLPAESVYDKPVSSLDILPTCLAAAGGRWQGDRPLDGVNLLPHLCGDRKEAPHEYLFWRRGVAAAVRHGDWKLIRVEGNPPLLFNLADDLGETTNLAERHPDCVQSLLAKLAEWERGLAPPKWKEGERWERNQVLKHRLEVVGRQAERKYP